jgi:hypothetical protein
VKTINLSNCIAVIVCCLIASPTPAHAQAAITTAAAGSESDPWNRGVPVERREQARTLFLEGNRLFNVPLFSQAVEKYSEAITRWKHPAFYFNLAFAELNLGKDVEARDNLEQALKFGEKALGAERFHEAQKQLKDVEGHLGRLRISCPTGGAEVTLDGATLFVGPDNREVWVKAQAHEVTAKKRGYLSEAKRVAVSSGQIQALDFKLVTLSEAADTGRRWAIWKPWSVVAAGSAVALSSGVLHALSARDFSDYDKRFQQLPCATTTGCGKTDIPVTLADQLSRANREQQLAVAGYVVGGATVVAGAILLYMNRPRLIEQQPAATATAGVVVAPLVSADSVGVLLSIQR